MRPLLVAMCVFLAACGHEGVSADTQHQTKQILPVREQPDLIVTTAWVRD